VNGLRAFGADSAAAFLCIAWRCQRAHGEVTASAARACLKLIMTSLLFIVAPSHDTSRRRRRTRLMRLAAIDSRLRIIASAIRHRRATIMRVGQRGPRPDVG